jgi:hypothetical protein
MTRGLNEFRQSLFDRFGILALARVELQDRFWILCRRRLLGHIEPERFGHLGIALSDDAGVIALQHPLRARVVDRSAALDFLLQIATSAL